MDNIFKILENSKKYPIIKKILAQNKFNQALKQTWDQIFGKLATQIHFSHVKDTTLYVNTSNYAWVTEIEFYKDTVLKKIQEHIGQKPSINNIKISYQPSSKSKQMQRKRNEEKL